MNDPNGLIYADGKYHLFYQYYPDELVWGPMHWGHAISTDLISWTHQPIALKPDEKGMIFSGSIVANKSVDGTDSHWTAFFTHHDRQLFEIDPGEHESQSIATSADNGLTWNKYTGNPVIANPGGKKDFRDPSVFWHEATQSWIMTLSVGHQAWFYGSPDLKNWTHLSSFEFDDRSATKLWECVSLFPITCRQTGCEVWILIQSQTTNGPQGGSGTQYFVGHFDGKTFEINPAFETLRRINGPQWVDCGPDNYAGIIWANAPLPAHQKLFIGWMSNWAYALEVPATDWRGMMTVPRVLEIRPWHNTYQLVWSFPDNFDDLHTKPESFSLNISENAHLPLGGVSASRGRLFLEISDLTDSAIILELHNTDETISVQIDPVTSTLSLDRSGVKAHSFHEAFTRVNAPVPIEIVNGMIELDIILDQYSMEIIFGSGDTVVTMIYFPEEPFDQIRFINSGESPVNVTGKSMAFNLST